MLSIRQAADIAHARRMAQRAADFAASLANRNGEWTEQVQYDWLTFLDALSFIADGSIEDLMQDTRDELGLDEEGYPLDDNGDTLPDAERYYVPLQTLRPLASPGENTVPPIGAA